MSSDKITQGNLHATTKWLQGFLKHMFSGTQFWSCSPHTRQVDNMTLDAEWGPKTRHTDRQKDRYIGEGWIERQRDRQTEK